MAAEIVQQLCMGCGYCSQSCRYGAITVCNKQVIINPELCVDCEECIFACPHGAIVI